MNRPLTFITVLSLSVLPLVFGACTPNQQQVQEDKPAMSATPTPEIKLPPKFGVFYESAQGPVELAEKTTLPAANPSFILYLEEVPAAAKLRLRIVKASGGPFIVDAGTVTSGETSQPKNPPKPGNYQNVFVFEYGEDAGVIETTVTAVNGRTDLYKATYSGTLKPGEYLPSILLMSRKVRRVGRKRASNSRDDLPSSRNLDDCVSAMGQPFQVSNGSTIEKDPMLKL